MQKRVAVAAGLGAACLAAVAIRGACAQSRKSGAPERPRLVVVISIDQCRADYMTRFSDLYLPAKSGGGVGGFRYLQQQGAWFPDCRYDHHRTVTAAGHAIIGTGAQPGINGIVGNSWYNRRTGKSVYCTDDPASEVVGALPGSKEKPMSAANLLATTVGDELELATGGQARTVSISLKDRAAILMAGHRADTPIWFDEDTGGWVSSTFYFKNGKLPAWVNEFNGLKRADALRQKPWTPSVDDAALRRVWNPKGASLRFNHPLVTPNSNYTPFTVSPAGNDLVFETARKAVDAEELGKDEIPDILTLNLASTDYVGHRWGPDSPELLDIFVQTDRQISEFLNYLNGKVPGGLKNITFAISADHGVATVPEVNAQSGVPASRSVVSVARNLAEKALDEQIGAGDWIASGDNGEFYFNEKTVAQFPKEPRARLENLVIDAIRDVPGVYLSVGRTAVLAGTIPHTDMGRRISNGVHPVRSGDVVVILDPQWLTGAAPIGTGTSHGTPFAYDTNVPLLISGFGIRKGTYTAPVTPAHLAPTLAHLVGCARPSAAETPLLPSLAGTEPGSK